MNRIRTSRSFEGKTKPWHPAPRNDKRLIAAHDKRNCLENLIGYEACARVPFLIFLLGESHQFVPTLSRESGLVDAPRRAEARPSVVPALERSFEIACDFVRRAGMARLRVRGRDITDQAKSYQKLEKPCTADRSG